MARIRPLDDSEAAPEALNLLQRQLAAHGRVTNMKRTLAHAPVALDALMTWYPLRDAVELFLDRRATILFAYAISTQTDCLICSTFFRRFLLDAGENPDTPTLSEKEQTLVEYGRQLARDPNGVSDELYGRLGSFLKPAEIVTLTAFGGLMVATNLFNNAMKVDLDDYLQSYRKDESLHGR